MKAPRFTLPCHALLTVLRRFLDGRQTASGTAVRVTRPELDEFLLAHLDPGTGPSAGFMTVKLGQLPIVLRTAWQWRKVRAIAGTGTSIELGPVRKAKP